MCPSVGLHGMEVPSSILDAFWNRDPAGGRPLPPSAARSGDFIPGSAVGVPSHRQMAGVERQGTGSSEAPNCAPPRLQMPLFQAGSGRVHPCNRRIRVHGSPTTAVGRLAGDESCTPVVLRDLFPNWTFALAQYPSGVFLAGDCSSLRFRGPRTGVVPQAL